MLRDFEPVRHERPEMRLGATKEALFQSFKEPHDRSANPVGVFVE